MVVGLGATVVVGGTEVFGVVDVGAEVEVEGVVVGLAVVEGVACVLQAISVRLTTNRIAIEIITFLFIKTSLLAFFA